MTAGFGSVREQIRADQADTIQKRSGEETVLQSTIKRLKDKLLASEVRDSSVCTRALLARGNPFEQQ